MKSNRQSILVVTVLLLLAGCGNDNEGATTPESDGRVALQVSGGIQTRATDTAWEANDAIGIYMLKAGTTGISEGAENRSYTTADGGSAFAPAAGQTIYFPIDGSKVDFKAYYPYQATLTDGAMELDVSDQTDLAALDLMTAAVATTETKPLDKNHPAVAFTFSHRLTKLELTIAPGNGITAGDLEGLTVEITRQRTSGSYAPLSGDFNVNDEQVKTVTMNTAADGTSAQAILLPNTDGINSVVPGRELVFTLTSGEMFYYAIPDDKFFKPGDKNLYNITINRTSVEVTATIEDWNPGNGSGQSGNAE